MKNYLSIIILIIIVINFLNLTSVHCQVNINAKPYMPTKDKHEKLSKYLKGYKMFSMEKNTLVNQLDKESKCSFKLNLNGSNSYDITIIPNELRASDYYAITGPQIRYIINQIIYINSQNNRTSQK